MAWADVIAKRAMWVAARYEKQEGRSPANVHFKKVGYDIRSGERLIEVKGVSESWKSYTWQSLHATTVRRFQKQPDKFFLYIVYFSIPKEKRNKENLIMAPYALYVLSGQDIKKHFRIKPMSYALTPISRDKLAQYRVTPA